MLKRLSKWLTTPAGFKAFSVVVICIFYLPAVVVGALVARNYGAWTGMFTLLVVALGETMTVFFVGEWWQVLKGCWQDVASAISWARKWVRG